MARWKPPAKARRDANEPEIFDTLREHGLSVEPIDRPGDALVGYAGRTWLLEVKAPTGTLTKTQSAFYEAWKGNKTIIRSVEGAQAFARMVREAEGETIAAQFVEMKGAKL